MVNIVLDEMSVSYGATAKASVAGVSLTLAQGSRIGLVGETGSGKSTTALAIAGLLPEYAVLRGGVTVGDCDLTTASPEELRKYRVSTVGYVPQNAQSALNPVRRVSFSFRERARGLDERNKSEVLTQARSLLQSVGFADTERILRAYPHQLSGGMRQRVLIAIALFGTPPILVADEPTSGLDVSIQAGIIKLISELDRSQSLVIITHDLGVAGLLCDEICVMYRGKVVEVGPTEQILSSPGHEYTRQLVTAAAM